MTCPQLNVVDAFEKVLERSSNEIHNPPKMHYQAWLSDPRHRRGFSCPWEFLAYNGNISSSEQCFKPQTAKVVISYPSTLHPALLE
jgi:hypothetical protein